MYKQYFEYNIDIEKAILGACLIEISAFPRIYRQVEAEMFYDDFHKQVFSCLTYMHENTQPIDLLTVTQKFYDLRNNPKFQNKAIDGLIGYELSLLTNYVASTAHLEYHALCIREMYVKRLLIDARNLDTDYGDVLEQTHIYQEKIKKALEIGASNDWERFKDILIKINQNLGTPKQKGIELGIKDFDKIGAGLQNGEMLVIGARPSVGKTAFACSVALNIAKNGKKVGIISLEMSNSKLATRVISVASDIEYWKIDRSLLQQNEISSLNEVSSNLLDLPIYFSEKTGVTVADIKAKCHKLKNVDVIFIDYLGLIEPDKAGTREQEVSKISRGLKLLAIEMNIPIVVLSQLNRAVGLRGKDAKPILTDLRDSGSLEQDADIVIFLHSDFKVGKLTNEIGESTEDERDIIVAKYRNGYTTDFKIGFDSQKMKFHNKEDDNKIFTTIENEPF